MSETHNFKITSNYCLLYELSMITKKLSIHVYICIRFKFYSLDITWNKICVLRNINWIIVFQKVSLMNCGYIDLNSRRLFCIHLRTTLSKTFLLVFLLPSSNIWILFELLDLSIKCVISQRCLVSIF